VPFILIESEKVACWSWDALHRRCQWAKSQTSISPTSSLCLPRYSNLWRWKMVVWRMWYYI